jgi:hypothetical protein
MRIADANGKATTLERRFQFHDAKHLHAVFRNGILLTHRRDLPEAERVDEGTDHFMVGDDLE